MARNISSWSGNSPHVREVAALQRLNEDLPNDWFGYANVFIKDPRKDAGQEVDIILVCEDRILMVDVKDWIGTVTQGRGLWYQERPGRPPKSMGGDPIQKLFHASNALIGQMKTAGISPLPYVMTAVIFARKSAEFSDVAQHAFEGGKGRVVGLDAFIAATSNLKRLDALIGVPAFESRPRKLTDKNGQMYKRLRNFFKVGRDFAAAETAYAGYRAKDHAITGARLWNHYIASSEGTHGDTALLRLWNFDADEGLVIDDTDREALVGREDNVQAFLRMHQTGRNVPSLAFKQSFNEGGAVRWELFQSHPDNLTLEAFLKRSLNDISVDVRLDLLQSLMEAGASLASALVAHRDIGEHSIWIDVERHRISLSNLVAARVPETTSAGRNLPNLARLSVADFDTGDDDASGESNVFCKDAHAFAYAGLKILLGPRSSEELDDSLPVYMLSDNMRREAGIKPALDKWFEKALAPNRNDRFETCIDSHTELTAALSVDRKSDPANSLQAHRRAVPCMFDHPQHEMVVQSRAGIMEWRTLRGARPPTLSRLWMCQSLGRERGFLDFVRRGAGLAILPPSVAPRIIECSIDSYGPFLCVEEISGTRLSDSSAEISSLGDEGVALLARRLVGALLTAHDLGLSHGDLSPANVIIEAWNGCDSDTEKAPQLRIIDWLDFSTDEAGPRETASYADDQADPFLRDRFALGRIILDVAESSSAAGGVLEAARSFASAEAVEGFPNWREISRWDISTLLAPSIIGTEEKVLVAIDGLADGQELIGEDGGFWVLFDNGSKERSGYTANPRVTLVGSGAAAVVEFDRLSGSPSKAFRKSITSGLEAAAGRHGLRIDVRLEAKASVGIDSWLFLKQLIGFDKLFLRDEAEEKIVKRPILSLSNDVTSVTQHKAAAPEVVKESETFTSRNSSPAPLKIWDAMLRAEAEIWPSATVLSKPERLTEKDGVYKIEVDLLVDPTRLEDGMIVYIKDRPSGKLDRTRSGDGFVIVFSDRGSPKVKEGEIIEFRSNGDVSNIRRRATALIQVAVSPQISELPNYFSRDAPAYLGEKAEIAPDPVDYGLNETQMGALKDLWRRGPVTFLQGPPGTGKTKFIAAFIHYALTIGGAKNVLLTAQTHEAVDGAAARVLEIFKEREESVELIRIAANAEKVDSALKDYHAVALQERVRAKFAAERTERVVILAEPLGIPPDFVRDCAKLLKGIVATALSVAALEKTADKADPDHLLRMRVVLERQCETLGLTDAAGMDPLSLRLQVLQEAAEFRNVRRSNAVGIVLKLFEAAAEYEEALGQRGALEPIFVRTRSLVCGTCVGLGDDKLGLANQAFDLVVVDEAARAQGSELAIPLVTARKALLVGDQNQLEPFVDREATRRAAETLGVDEADMATSDFERGFYSPYGLTASARLDIQYRMAPCIGALISDVFYEGKLKTGRAKPDVVWSGLPWPFDNEISWVDVLGVETAKAGRIRNESEVEDIVESLELLANSKVGENLLSAHLERNLSEAFIGVIAMYADQAVAIRKRVATSSLDRIWREQIKIGTVDSYQGKENSIVLVSLVRGNPKGSIGFLQKENRINVALSRAKERLVIFGSKRMFSGLDNTLAQALNHTSLEGRVAQLKQAIPQKAK